MSEVYPVAKIEGDQNVVAPSLYVDERLGEIVEYEFDMPKLANLLRANGMDDEFIASLSVEVKDIDDNSRQWYKESGYFGGQIPGGKYSRDTKTIKDYTFEHFRKYRQDPTTQVSTYTTDEAVSWLERYMNSTMIHETGHAIYGERIRRRNDRAEVPFSGSLGFAAVGLVGMAAGHLLGRKGSESMKSAVSRRLQRVGSRLAITGGVGASLMIGGLIAEGFDGIAQDRWVAYNRWRYDHTDLDERFARKFEQRHKAVKVVRLTPRDGVDL